MVDSLSVRPAIGDSSGSRLAELFVEGLPVDGASISVVGSTGSHLVVSLKGAIAASLETMQFELGEGPHWDALASGRPVLIGTTGEADLRRWPAFAAQVGSLDVAAMFSFPMTLGAAVVGVVDLCRRSPGALSERDVRKAATMTRSVTVTAVRAATSSAHSESDRGHHPEMRREVHQATGMLASQLDTSVTDAFATLRAFAFAQDRSIEEVAADIVHRRLDLTDPLP